ncbi:hypothetical protein QQZ08_007309 [Neonectria magnoliae]|uniref:Zn(2)-C6 fungal-type domain-containing protein n=1 Tax=Neonectria magnoliae TaxID=2732573 RepID=A0ABR1HXX9_9HYPO
MDPGRNSSSTLSPGPGQQSGRKERGAIAAQETVLSIRFIARRLMRIQACETCRNRKQKCDEQRPKCGTCQKFKLDCLYREPQPTKKDRTLVEILDRIKNVESKIDNLSYKSNTSNSSAFGTSQSTSVFPASTPLLVEADGQDGLRTSSAAPGSPTAAPHGGYHYDSSVSKMLEWPIIRQIFDSLEQKPQSPQREFDLSMLPEGIRDSSTSLPTDGIQPIDMSSNSTMQVPLQFPGSSNLNINVPTIEWDTIQRLTKGYFDLFNFLYPLMDRQWFDSNILSPIINTGFQEGTNSTVALLVFALGEVALTASEAPTAVYKQRSSGIKGGTVDRPPGITYFNEARKHMGFALTEVSLENVQMFALASLYYGSCGQAVVGVLAPR